MIVSQRQAQHVQGRLIQRRMSVSNCCRKSVHDAMRLAYAQWNRHGHRLQRHARRDPQEDRAVS